MPYVMAGQTALDFGMKALNAVADAHARTKALDRTLPLLAKQRQAQIGYGNQIAAQWAPMQELGYGALVPLAQMAGQAPAGQVNFRRTHSVLPGVDAGAGPGYAAAPGADMPHTMDPAMLSSIQSLIPRAGTPFAPLQAGEVNLHDLIASIPGADDSTGIRNMTTGGRDGSLVARTPAESAYIDEWLAAHPGEVFTDAQLHGYRNQQTARQAGLTDAQWSGLAPEYQKWLLQQITKGHTQHALDRLRREGRLR